jgi:signal transduction histidine kinase
VAEPRTVLCVDDNDAQRDNLREILGDEGYRVLTARSCAEARRLAHSGFDVGLVDVRLPDGDGVALAAELRQLVPDAQIIMLTGFATTESAVAAVRAGAWAYLLKPCSTPDLLVAVEQATRQLAHVEERRQLARRARVAEKLAAIGTLTAGLSHEIKNPLNAAALQLAVLERRVRRLGPEAADLLGPLELVQAEVTRLNQILEEFLEFARPRELAKAPVDLEALLVRVTDLLAPQAEQAGVRLVVDGEAVPHVSGEPGRLQQAFLNLVLNALEASDEGGEVCIRYRHDGDAVTVAVEDSGPGIAEDVLPRIFEPFFTTKPGGSGLGLPLVHSIVELHDGSIGVERREEGGTRFVVRLPIK